MYREIIELLCCPVCKKELRLLEGEEVDGEIIEGKLVCEDNHLWEIHDAVVDFHSKEQDFGNSWSDYYKEMDFDEIDRQIEEKMPENLKKMFGDAKDDIINYVNNKRPEYLIDIATGRGMLLTKLAKEIKSDTHIICLDLSFAVLKYDRIKVKRINENIKVSFIACDATNIPIKDASVDGAVSFFGIINMLGLIEKALKECFRVLKGGKSLINSCIFIKDNTQGYKNIYKFALENGMDLEEGFGTKEAMDMEYSHTSFKEVEHKIIGEGIGEKNELDLIPIENEWYSVVNLYSTK